MSRTEDNKMVTVYCAAKVHNQHTTWATFQLVAAALGGSCRLVVSHKVQLHSRLNFSISVLLAKVWNCPTTTPNKLQYQLKISDTSQRFSYISSLQANHSVHLYTHFMHTGKKDYHRQENGTCRDASCVHVCRIVYNLQGPYLIDLSYPQLKRFCEYPKSAVIWLFIWLVLWNEWYW